MFNAKQYREQNPVERALPVGWYKVKVETSSKTMSSTGYEMVKMSLRIVDSISGYFINALQWENLVFGHESEITRKYANDKLAEIMLAAGVEVAKEWEDIALHGGEFAMSIGKSAKTGRVYAVYRPLAVWEAMVAKHNGVVPAPSVNGLITEPYTPPAAYTEINFDDDIPF